MWSFFEELNPSHSLSVRVYQASAPIHLNHDFSCVANTNFGFSSGQSIQPHYALRMSPPQSLATSIFKPPVARNNFLDFPFQLSGKDKSAKDKYFL
jgi:hypothetical protein